MTSQSSPNSKRADISRKAVFAADSHENVRVVIELEPTPVEIKKPEYFDDDTIDCEVVKHSNENQQYSTACIFFELKLANHIITPTTFSRCWTSRIIFSRDT